MMKLWLFTRHLPDPTNPNRPIPSVTLHTRHNCLLISNTHLPRRQLWLKYSIYTCKRSFHILYLPLHSRRTWPILWVLHLSRNMKH
uniref:Uncharacterized protein n=1 Tax=Phocoena sinus TaxID=42100 RepID=A0A8C9BGT8_PHOSS